MLSMSSNVAMATRRMNRSGGNMDRLFFNRAQRIGERRAAQEHRNYRRMLHDQRREDNTRYNREQRTEAQERMIRHREGREVVGLLEQIVHKLEKLGKGSVLGNVLAGGLLGRFLARSGFRGKAQAGIYRDAAGRWRDASGKYVKAPQRNALGRAVDTIRESKFGRGVAKVAKPIGRVAAPVARVAGRAAGAIGRAGGTLLGKALLPVAAGMAIYDGVHGMRNADKILGRQTDLGEKTAVGVYEAINGALLGLPNWVSENVFGMSFSKMMIDGLKDIDKKIKDTITESIEKGKALIGKTVGAVGSYFGDAFKNVSNYVKDVQAAGSELTNAVKSHDFMGAAAALTKIGKLLYKGAIVAPKAIAKTAAAGTTSVAAGSAYVGAAIPDMVDSAKRYVGKVTGSTKNRYADQRADIEYAAKAFGLDPKELAAKASIESNFKSDAKAKTSSATGTFQFIDSTWLSEVAKASKHKMAPKELKAYAGLFNNGKFTGTDQQKRELLALRKNAGVSAFVGASFTAGNKNDLAQSGIQATAGNTYLAHFLGIGGARKLLSADPNASAADVVGMKAAKANRTIFFHPNGRPKTVREVAQWATDKTGKARASVLAMDASLGGTQMAAANTSNTQVAVTPPKSKSPTASAKPSVTATPVENSNVVPFPVTKPEIPTAMAARAPTNVPLVEEMPKPIPAETPNDVLAKLKALQAAAMEEPPQSSKKQTEVRTPVSSGRGGLPSVNDVADRPRIDLQPIVTTIV